MPGRLGVAFLFDGIDLVFDRVDDVEKGLNVDFRIISFLGPPVEKGLSFVAVGDAGGGEVAFRVVDQGDLEIAGWKQERCAFDRDTSVGQFFGNKQLGLPDGRGRSDSRCLVVGDYKRSLVINLDYQPEFEAVELHGSLLSFGATRDWVAT